jgi:DedD protein
VIGTIMAWFNFGKQDDAKTVQAPANAESVEVLRQRAKRRLIGSAVLVLAGVVGFPLLFDTQPRPVAIDVPIEIPDRNNVKPLAPPVVSNAPLTPAPGARSESTVDPGTSLGSREEIVTAPTVSVPKVTQNTASALTESTQSATKTVANTAKAQADQAAADQAAADKLAADKAAADKAAADKAAKDKAAKDKAAAEKAAKDKADKASEDKKAAQAAEAKKAADAARAKALLEGKPGNGTPAGASAPAVAATAPAAEGRFIVQFGSFSDAPKAREARQKVERAGLKTYSQVAETANGQLIRVRVGPFPTRAEAEKAAAKIKSLDLPAAILTL